MDEVLVWGTAASLVFTTVIKVLDYRLSAIPHEPYKGPFNYYWVLPHPTLWTRLLLGILLRAPGGPLGDDVLRPNLRENHEYHSSPGQLRRSCSQWPFCRSPLVPDAHLLRRVGAGYARDNCPRGSNPDADLGTPYGEQHARHGGGKAPAALHQFVPFCEEVYHGYYFSWAIIYDFWYHPMEGTRGHLWGFFYNFMLMLQSSLFLTRSHLNKWWRLLLELMVAPHGVFVAINQEGNIWPMFLFGFATVFLLTQMHSSLFTRGQRVFFTVVYFSAFVILYWGKPFHRLNEPLRIPFIDYLGVLFLAGILKLVMMFM